NEIDSDYFAVVSECESYGKETDAELSITEFALRAAGYVDALVEALEKAQQRITQMESRTVTVKLPKARRVKLVSGEYVNGWTAYDVSCALSAAGIKVEAE
ncbi:TPA: ead/Ea22-like family protein, partial [Klebsiella pneumoniae]|nr:ead/Ea22-like family protein [Klebsiella pneumoniae]